MSQPGFDFVPSLPIAGKTPRTRHASATGAQQASTVRAQLTLRYLDLLRKGGPRSDQSAAACLGCGLSSINSVRDALGDTVIDSGDYESKTWPSGKVTRRTKWTLAPVGGQGVAA